VRSSTESAAATAHRIVTLSCCWDAARDVAAAAAAAWRSSHSAAIRHSAPASCELRPTTPHLHRPTTYINAVRCYGP